MSKRKTIEEFIKESKLIHNDFFDYSLVIYKNAHTPVIIVCPVHGKFKQTPHNHLRHGCRKCGKLLDEKMVIDRMLEIHGDKYDYSKFSYKGMHENSIIICKKHGEFGQTPANHLAGKGCKKCSQNHKKSKKEIIKRLNEIHNNKYNYSQLVFTKVKDTVEILCPVHGFFQQILNNHLRGSGCPFCNESHGEKMIENFLIQNKIEYKRQKKFKGCKDKRLLAFDFYLPLYNTCIEYDGEHHFFDVLNWKNCEYTKKHDNIKNKFCKENKIKLIRIKYNDNIIEKLKNIKK